MSRIVPINRSSFEEYMSGYQVDVYLQDNAVAYRAVYAHLKACALIANDIFGKGCGADLILSVHEVVGDVIGNEAKEIEFEPEGSEE